MVAIVADVGFSTFARDSPLPDDGDRREADLILERDEFKKSEKVGKVGMNGVPKGSRTPVTGVRACEGGLLRTLANIFHYS